MKQILATAILAALGLAAAPASAEVRFSGFGQVVAGKTTDDGGYPGSNYDSDIDFAEESLFGLQINADISERIEAVAQIIGTGDDGFDAELAWAYANIRLDHGFSTKVGRQRSAFYRYSDFLDVGYAYPWMRPPTAVYNLGLDTLDGVTVSHAANFGSWYSHLQVQYGGYDGELNNAGALPVETRNQAGFAWEMEYDEWLSLRAAWFRSDFSAHIDDLEMLAGVFAAYGLDAVAANIVADDDEGVFSSIGAKVERNGWLLVGERITTKVDGALVPRQTDWYVSAGRRFGKVMPYVVYGERKGEPRRDILGLLPQDNPLYPVLEGAVAGTRNEETYTSIGARWDFMSNVAFKADWTRFESKTGARAESDLASVGLVFTF
ncbi:hypothetical protein H0E84_16335 [Luteimonas sp. SJ-92]|uniref:Porin domain-containing protein n=1 Tax=Luteimonas salinisoli TaxID=2752307 RepID=A0A853JH91_9GAMM|nr:porin [Luteimonas salinisoli]NZA27949.1 hypothetical protein [Luteimonas salinisoli]